MVRVKGWGGGVWGGRDLRWGSRDGVVRVKGWGSRHGGLGWGLGVKEVGW